MTETIETGLGTIFYRAPSATVKVASALIEDDFENVEYLRVDRLRVAASPEVDTCELHYRYGNQLREDRDEAEVFAPLDIVGKFVRVEIESTVDGDDPIVWYGIAEAETKLVDGAVSEAPSGTQAFVAYGLLRLLEKTIVNKSWIKTGATTTATIETALPFNSDLSGEFVVAGNMALVTDGGESRPVFAERQQSAIKWSAADIVKYLLYRFAPKNSVGTDANNWAIDPDADIDDIAGWYEMTLDAELQTVKSILDRVLDRRRGVSYFVRCQPQADTSQANKIYVTPFSFAVNDVTLPSSAVLGANQNQKTLDFENALDIVEARVSDVASARYHKVRVYGEFMTTTFTTSPYVSPNALEPDWTDAEATAFLDGASAAGDYPADTLQRYLRNAAARTADNLRHVFTRYKLREAWDGTVIPWHDDIATVYNVAPEIGEEDAEIDPDTATAPDGETLWVPGTQIERHLPFHNRFDYSGTKIDDDTAASVADDEDADLGFVPLLAYIRTTGSDDAVRNSGGTVVTDPPRYEHVEFLNHKSFDTTDGRRWAAHVHVRNNFPGVEIRAHPPQMMALTEWGSAADTDPSSDPTQMNGLSWQQLFVTMCIRVPKRIQCTKQILPLSISEPIAELAVYVPNARLDYVVPYTTVRLDDGLPIVTTSGGAVRDDRMRLADVARGAAEWYGNNRRTLSLTYRQVRNLFQLGWLITDIGANYTEAGINTPITSIEYVFNGPSAPVTKIDTSFAPLDYSR